MKHERRLTQARGQPRPASGLPRGWTRIDAGGPGPFVTRQTFRRPDGAIVTWTSRDRRKRHSLLNARAGTTWWAPRAIGWWIAVLFAIGSICFALGAAPRYVDAVGSAADGVTFFVGSLFFTTAAFLQYLEMANTPNTVSGDTHIERRRWLSWEPDRIDWWAAVVQFGGTLFFNVSTAAAMLDHLSAAQTNRLVWRPDVSGSICFLVASGLAWAEVSHGPWSWRPRVVSWWIAAVNLAGSIAFGISAAASHIVPATDQARNVTLMNLGTFLGAIGFLVGAVLLLPERTQADAGSNARMGREE